MQEMYLCFTPPNTHNTSLCLQFG